MPSDAFESSSDDRLEGCRARDGAPPLTPRRAPFADDGGMDDKDSLFPIPPLVVGAAFAAFAAAAVARRRVAGIVAPARASSNRRTAGCDGMRWESATRCDTWTMDDI